MAKRVSADRWIFGSVVLLVFLGLIMVFSASAVMASERFGSAYSFLFRQFAWALAGFLAMLILMNVDHQKLKHPALVFGLLGITAFLLVAVFFLDRTHNVHRWVRLGPLSFQPSELAKPALILFLAYFLESRTKSLTDLRNTLLPALAPAALFFALIAAQPDLGTALMCLAIASAVLFVAGFRLRYFGYALLPLIPALYFLVWRVPWRKERILAFFDPFSDPQGRGFHTIQSLIAVGTGGVSGAGLMEGKQKLFYLPEPQTDFIFAVISEEFGLIGSIFIVVLFLIFCLRGFRVALRAKDPFARLLAVGITAMIGIQAFFNISVVLALLPTKGIPLPFLSYGGSSLLIMLASVGVLLNISKQVE
ncbi:MAG: putative lipid II flippase FtsW [Acidobacteriales bacterium]|nr:putative lipid II flippase FtsW [Terriglobales bacterium]